MQGIGVDFEAGNRRLNEVCNKGGTSLFLCQLSPAVEVVSQLSFLFLFPFFATRFLLARAHLCKGNAH